jgi:hypothetical protein
VVAEPWTSPPLVWLLFFLKIKCRIVWYCNITWRIRV